MLFWDWVTIRGMLELDGGGDAWLFFRVSDLAELEWALARWELDELLLGDGDGRDIWELDGLLLDGEALEVFGEDATRFWGKD